MLWSWGTVVVARPFLLFLTNDVVVGHVGVVSCVRTAGRDGVSAFAETTASDFLGPRCDQHAPEHELKHAKNGIGDANDNGENEVLPRVTCAGAERRRVRLTTTILPRAHLPPACPRRRSELQTLSSRLLFATARIEVDEIHLEGQREEIAKDFKRQENHANFSWDCRTVTEPPICERVLMCERHVEPQACAFIQKNWMHRLPISNFVVATVVV